MILRGKHFFGGVRLKGNKQLTANAPLSPLEVEKAVIPVRQHIGAPAEPIVEVGQKVLRGTLIAKSEAPLSARVHASIAGTVTAIGELPDGKGGSCIHITIERGGDGDDFLPPLKDPSAEDILRRVEEAGIVGMGGAGFPSHIKLRPSSPVDTLLLNGAECEPYLTCDDTIMRTRTKEIVRGARYLAAALGAERILIGIEKNKPEAIERFSEHFDVVPLKKRYPMGSEKHIVFTCTGRKIPVGKLPAHVGVDVQNVATALAVCEAVELGKPLIERVVTVSGTGIAAPQNLLCPVGAPLSALIFACGGKRDAVKLVAGGPMTGTALVGEDAVVTKTSSGFLFLSAQETNAQSPTPCINCGRCADACPMKLLPMQIEFYTEAREYEAAQRYGGVTACIECGACGYVCPARRPLIQAIRTAKAALRRKV